MEYTSLFAPMQIIIGLYLLYAGISGKGQAYSAENMPKSTHEEYARMIRTFCLSMAPLMLAGGAFDYFGAQYPALRIAAWVTNGLVFLAVAAITVLIMRLRKRGEKK